MPLILVVMNIETPLSLDAAREIYGELCEGNYEVLKPSEKIGAFYQELIDKYPIIDPYSDREIGDSPGIMVKDVSGGAVLMGILWEHTEEVVPFVTGLAEKHGLACFSEIDGEWYLPPFPIP
jgi:hypothetical protein